MRSRAQNLQGKRLLRFVYERPNLLAQDLGAIRLATVEGGARPQGAAAAWVVGGGGEQWLTAVATGIDC